MATLFMDALTKQRLVVLRGVALVVVLPMLVVGCASASPTGPITVRISAEKAQAEFGTLGVATVERMPGVSISGQAPSSRGEAAGTGALAGAVLPPVTGFTVGSFWGLALGILIAPLTAIVGTIYGVLSAGSPEEVERATQMLETTGQAAHVQHQVRDLVITELRREHFGDVMPIGAADTAKPAVDTVVEVWISYITLEGEGPTLTLHLSGGMRVLGPGVLVEHLPIDSEGQRHSLLAWAADDAKIFREQIAHESEKLAKDVVNALLSRPIPNLRLPPTPQPPEDITCPESSVWTDGCTSSQR
jgi:hypothetical protein